MSEKPSASETQDFRHTTGETRFQSAQDSMDDYEEETETNGFITEMLQRVDQSKAFSLEVTPTKHLDIEPLLKLKPYFISVTWIAQYDQEPEEIPPIKLCQQLIEKEQTVLLHLPGRNLTKQRAQDILAVVKAIGIKNLLCIGGDPRHAVEKKLDKCDFAYTQTLIEFIRKQFGNYFTIAVAGYPEKTADSDMEILKSKINSGADFIITQASYSYDNYKNFGERCSELDIKVPILPGIFMPNSYEYFMHMKHISNTNPDDNIMKFMSKNRDSPDAIKKYIKHLDITLMSQLRENEHFSPPHIFTLNDVEFTTEIIGELNAS